ncbi:MAG: DUF3152 domain-containing protein [Actinomycetes bacterium]
MTLLRLLVGLVCVATVWGLGQPASATTVVGPPRPALLAAGSPPPSLVLAADPPEVATGRASLLTGRLTDPASGQGLPGASVRLESLAPDGSWLEVAALTTDGAGAVGSSQALGSTTVYRMRAGEPCAADESVSGSVTVTVRTLTALWDRPAVRLGREATVRGVLAADAGSLVRLERRLSGAWHRSGRTRTAADGSYSFTVTPTRPGFSRWRVVRDADASWPASVLRLPALDSFRLHRYSVATRGTVRADMGVFRDVVAATYADPRGWLRSHRRFREVARGGGAFTVVLSQARYLPAYSSVCSSTYSCRVGRYVIINQDRWRKGSPYFPGTLEQYRRMVVNHETGHWLGRGHAYCSGPGRLAPVMQQQSKGMHGCRVNPWPLPREIRAVS